MACMKKALLLALALCATYCVAFAAQDTIKLDQVHVSLGHYRNGKWSAVISFAASQPINAGDYEGAVNSSSVAESDLFTHVDTCIMAYGPGTSYTYEVDDNLARSVLADFSLYHSPALFHVEIVDLPSDANVYYMLGLRELQTKQMVVIRNESFHFRTPPAPGSKPGSGMMVFSVIGDMGQTKYSLNTRDSLMWELRVSQPKPSFALIVGDVSYADGNASRWDTWGRLMEPLFSELPLMVLPGNHEIEIDNRTKDAFVHYRNRFRMPQALAESVGPATAFSKEDWERYSVNLKYDGGSSFYSFDAGFCHIIALNVYNTHAVLNGGENLQENFLRDDLKRVNRTKTPFVLVFLHAPLYNTNRAHQFEVAPQLFKKWAEPLFLEFGVDVVMSGHVHAYERSLGISYDEYSHTGPVYVTLGDGGNREQLYNEWISPAPRNVYRDGRHYGHGEFRVYNDTHLEWVWKPNPAQGGTVREDRTWIRPFSLRQRPASVLPPGVSVFLVVVIGLIGLCFSWLACRSYSKEYEYSESLIDKGKVNGESSSSLSLELT